MVSDEVFALAIITMLFILVVVLVWQGFKTWQARTVSLAEIAREEAYRKLAEEAVAVQQKMAADLKDLRTRITAMEKILRDVE